MSYCCVPKDVLRAMGVAPFSFGLGVAEDYYFFNLLAISGSGPVVYDPTPLAGYRIRKGSLSEDRLKGLECIVQAFELLKDRYKELSDPRPSTAFRLAFASGRRHYARVLMAAGRVSDARRELLRSLRNCRKTASITKSLAWLFITYMPALLRPRLPSIRREV